jgi:hypothetical protein
MSITSKLKIMCMKHGLKFNNIYLTLITKYFDWSDGECLQN